MTPLRLIQAIIIINIVSFVNTEHIKFNESFQNNCRQSGRIRVISRQSQKCHRHLVPQAFGFIIGSSDRLHKQVGESSLF
jgi:hypothetical protein